MLTRHRNASFEHVGQFLRSNISQIETSNGPHNKYIMLCNSDYFHGVCQGFFNKVRDGDILNF